MIEASAIVERVEGHDAWVRIQDRVGGCGRCDEPGGCRSTGIAYAFKAPRAVFRVRNGIGARPGDAVRLRMQDGAPLRGAMLGYGLGVAMLLAGAGLGSALAPATGDDLPVLIGSVVGLAGAIAINRVLARSRRLRAVFGIEMAPGGACAQGSEGR